MLEVHAATQRSFIVGGEIVAVYEFYSSLPRIIPYLPHVNLVAEADALPAHFRVAYESLELGTYRITIVCDLEQVLLPEQNMMRLQTAEPSPFPPVESKVSMTSAVAAGAFEIESRFSATSKAETRIDYALALTASLPKPGGLVLMPDPILKALIERIAAMRVDEIVDQFVTDSAAAFHSWQRIEAEK